MLILLVSRRSCAVEVVYMNQEALSKPQDAPHPSIMHPHDIMWLFSNKMMGARFQDAADAILSKVHGARPFSDG